MSGILTQPEKVDLILSRGADYFGIPKDEISVMNPPEKRGNGKYSNEKKYLAYVLKENTVLTHARIAETLGYRNHSVITHLHRTVEDELSTTPYGRSKIKQIYNDLIKYIGL